ncbi:MAG: transketolase [Gemmatimonadetes bacterium]|nr:MAG: transketolase [Gemmatimonadetes bacterium 13_1_40CM_3_66_12]OLD86564.1 MAG: transketolase [Gemmatimonadetes bacterium 13_1_20CM_4_66_11]PYP95137.1 MAG: transketolase [Gemmatimonadota bacterium]
MTETVTRVGRELDQLCINTVRALAMDAVQQAESGHPGTPMALAPLAYVLWQRHLRYNPANPDWLDRDRFVLSAGHACMLLYSVLYLTGYDLTLDDIKQFRQWGSRTPGHSEHGVTPGVEATTGPLGQGVGNAVGMAIAEAQLAALFNRPGHAIIDHHTYFVASDGDLMEGVSHEACSLAGHLKLGKLIGFYDDNRITIDGSTDLAFSDDTAKRFEAYGWHVQRIQDGNDLDAIDAAITQAKRVTDRPSLIIVRTHIAWGSPHKQDTAEAHGAPLGVDEVKATKQNLGWPSLEPFYVPEEALEHWRRAKDRGARLESDWQKRWDGYRSAHPDLATELERRLAGQLPAGWDAALPVFGPKDAQATRAASGKVLNAIAAKVPELIGGSGDLTGSNNTEIKGGGVFSAAARTGRNFHFGVREHGMGAALNGITLHGGFIPFGGTFLIFSDYMRPSIRLAALTPLKPIYVFTHDSIGLGEDGPTHQPIEQLAALRAIPNMTVIRPSDPTEVVEAWRAAIAHRNGPVALVLTRQKITVVDRSKYAPAAGLHRGGYVLADSPRPDVVLMATGSEVELILGAYERLKADGRRPRAVSMPCLEYFAKQQQDYREAVLPPGVPRIAVEAAAPQSWYRWVPENQGVIMGIERFGESAPYQRIYQEFGLTVDAVVAQATDLA